MCAQLVQYDASQKRNPFTLVDVNSIAPMKCNPAALECWRRECDTPLFARYRPPAPPPTATAVEVPSEFEVTYEALLAAQKAPSVSKDGKRTCAYPDQ